jgi:PAS domain S-box-containing protein
MSSVCPKFTASRSERTMALALRLIHAEDALEAHTAGQIDAIVDSAGHPYLLRCAQEQLRMRERALVESEMRYRSLFENMLEGYAYCRLLYEGDRAHDFIYLEVNSAFQALTGLENVTGQKFSEVLPEVRKTHPELLEVYSRVASTGQPERFDILLTPLEIWLSISVYSRQPEHFVAVFANITGRKNAESKVQADRALLRTLIDSIPDLIFFKDRDSRFLGCNQAFERHFDLEEEKLIGLSDYDIVPTAAAESYIQQDREMISSGVPQRSEDWLPSPKGGGGHFETVKTPYHGSSGEWLGVVAVSRDISERRRAEEIEHRLGERLKLAVEAGHVGIWEMDVVAQTIQWDAQMRILYGMPPDDGRDVMEEINRALHPDDAVRVTKEFEEALAMEDKPLDTEFRIIRANDGCVRVIRSMATVIRNERGEPQRIVGSNWDVTEERVRERKLSEALEHEKDLSEQARAGDRAKSEFLAVMSHEIRTPMTGILGFSEFLAAAPNLPADCREFVQTITSSGEALLRILDDVLVFSRLEAGGLKVENSIVRPLEILSDIHSLFAPQAAEKGLSFPVASHAEVPDPIWSDAGRLRQVLLNLVGNAIKFTAEGAVTIGTCSVDPVKTEDARVRFYVRDTGPGIPPEELEQIFEPFSQADSSISRRYGGTGLGLSISRSLVELLGGTLSVTSTVGKGSEFLVTLPAGVPEGTASPLGGNPQNAFDETFAIRHPLCILLVEDDPTNLKLMLMILRQLGYDPLVARDGVEAREINEARSPDCILMDLQMPRKGGLQATIEIRAWEKAASRATRVFIAALTANISLEDHRRCLDAGMDGYMNKPINRARLAEILEQASERKRAGGKFPPAAFAD